MRKLRVRLMSQRDKMRMGLTIIMLTSDGHTMILLGLQRVGEWVNMLVRNIKMMYMMTCQFGGMFEVGV